MTNSDNADKSKNSSRGVTLPENVPWWLVIVGLSILVLVGMVLGIVTSSPIIDFLVVLLYVADLILLCLVVSRRVVRKRQQIQRAVREQAPESDAQSERALGQNAPQRRPVETGLVNFSIVWWLAGWSSLVAGSIAGSAGIELGQWALGAVGLVLMIASMCLFLSVGIDSRNYGARAGLFQSKIEVGLEIDNKLDDAPLNKTPWWAAIIVLNVIVIAGAALAWSLSSLPASIVSACAGLADLVLVTGAMIKDRRVRNRRLRRYQFG